jgi:hypothetical protein
MTKPKKTVSGELHQRHIYFSRINLGIIVLIFAIIGAITLIHSFAAPNPNLPGDLNNDNVVNALDLSILLGNYGTANSAADINGDGTVNALDLSALLAHYGQSISGALTFQSVTSWARPSPATPTAASSAGWRLVPFSTKAGLDSAISNMQGHDYIYYNGANVLTITSTSSAPAYSIHDKNPSLPVVINFGTSNSIWNPGIVSGSYVKFDYASTSNQGAFWLYGSSNIRFYGGYMTSPLGGSTLLLQPSETNTIHDILWYDGYIYYAGGSGIAVRGSTNSTGTASNAYNLDLRFEVNRFSMLPSNDNHTDKGTGFHGLILHGSDGGIHDSRFVVYGHDALKPGEVSNGITWPEGAGGSVIEQGNETAANYDNDIMYALGKNNLMIPNGTNPGSTAQQTGGNVFNLWGHIKLNGNIIGWAEGDNVSGSIIHSDSGSWFPGSPALTVQHGRHNQSNLSTAGGNISQPYPTTTPTGTPLNIIYQDIQ